MWDRGKLVTADGRTAGEPEKRQGVCQKAAGGKGARGRGRGEGGEGRGRVGVDGRAAHLLMLRAPSSTS